MKKLLTTISFLLFIGALSFGQSTETLVNDCVMNAGNTAKYLKDFRVQLGKSAGQTELRYKANMSLWKNTKYRFNMCNSQDSKGQLILSLKDESNKEVLSSFDPKTGKSYPFIDFICQKSGKYQLSFDFTNGQQGSGVGVVSMIK